MSKMGNYILGISEDLAKFAEEFDPYEFNNTYSDRYDAVVDATETIMDDSDGVLEYLKQALDYMNCDTKCYIDLIADCRKLIKEIEPLAERRAS